MADGSVIIDTELDRSGLKTGLAAMAGDVQAGIKAAITAAAAALAAGVAAAVKYGAEYESAFAGVRKTVDTSMFESQEAIDAFFGDLSNNLLQMSERLPFAAAEIAAVTEAAGQLGIQNDALLTFTETMVNLGVATNLTADEAATQLARFANIVQMPQSEFERLGSTIVALGNNLATTEADIVNMGMRLAGTGSQVGMTEAQIMALAGALSSVGLEAEAGGSSISQVLKMMQNAAEGGGEALSALARVAGMTSQEFKTAFETDATGALMAFLRGLQDTERNGKSAIGVIAELGEISELSALDNLRVSDALTRASNASDLLASALDIANQAWTENTALSNEAAQRYETLESRSIMLANSAKNLGIALYQSVEGNLKDAVSFAQELIQQLESAFSTGGFAGLAGAVGDVLAQAASYIAQYAPILAQGAVDLVQSFVQGLVTAAPQIANVAAEIGVTLLDGVLSIGAQLIVLAGELIVDLAGSIAENAPQIIDTVIAAGVQIVQELIQTLSGMIPQIITCGFQLLTSLVSALPQIIAAIIGVLPQIITAIVSALTNNIPLIIQCGIQLLTSLVQALPEIITAIVAALPQIIAAVISALLGNIGLIVQCGIQLFTSLITALPQIISTVIASIPQIISAVVQAILGARGQIVEAGSNLLSGLADGIGNAIGGVVARAREAAARVANSVKSFFGIASPSKLFKNEIGKNLMLGLADGIIDNGKEAVKATKTVADNIADVDFGPGDPRLGVGVPDYNAIVATATGAVNMARYSTGRAAAGSYYSGLDLSDKIDKLQSCLETISEKIKIPEAIDARVNINGRQLSREITPYVAEDLEWYRK